MDGMLAALWFDCNRPLHPSRLHPAKGTRFDCLFHRTNSSQFGDCGQLVPHHSQLVGYLCGSQDFMAWLRLDGDAPVLPSFCLCPSIYLYGIRSGGRTCGIVMPASLLLGGLGVGVAWIELRQKGLTLAATVSEVRIASQRNHLAHVQKNRTFEMIVAAFLCLLGILKLVDLFSH